jgi:hypothetical protein
MAIQSATSAKKVTFKSDPAPDENKDAATVTTATTIESGPARRPTAESRRTALTALHHDPSHQQTYAALHAAVPKDEGTRTKPVDSEGGTQQENFTFTLGPPTRPDIQHDNGFLQNPDDPGDPNPLPTREPTDEERALYAEWERRANAIQLYQGLPEGVQDVIADHAPEDLRHFVSDGQLRNIPDGIGAYQHFLHGNGADRQFSYDKFVAEDPAGQEVLANATLDLQNGAAEIYEQLIAENPDLAGQPITFEMTSNAVGVGSSPGYRYPETENWQKAIGAHQIWLSANVTVTPGEDGQPTFSMDMTLHGEDRYNFNPGAADITTGTLDAENGVFEETGLAHQYMHYGQLQRHVAWSGTPDPATTTITNPNR